MSGLQAFTNTGKLIFDANKFKVLKAGVTISYDSYTYRNVGTTYYITFTYTLPAIPANYSNAFIYFAGRPICVPLKNVSQTKSILMYSIGATLSAALSNIDSTGKVLSV